MQTKKLFKFIFYGFLTWFLLHSFYVIYDGLRDEKKSAELAVVFGNKVNQDGTLSKRLEKRLECGLNLYQTGRIHKILVSGGLGKEGHWEGSKMREYYLQHGIPDSCLLVDNLGNNSHATVDNTAALQNITKNTETIVVSQFYHVTRIKKLYRKKGFQNISSVCPRYFELRDIYSTFREFFAFYLN